MSNYVWHRVVCDQQTLENYFIDYDPMGTGKFLKNPYISFNKLFGVKSLNEYVDQVGIHISYGYSFSWHKRTDGLIEIKFTTRWQYPIQAMIKAVELSHGINWYAVEENHIYVSKFYWSDSVKEDVLILEDEYEEWSSQNEDFYMTLEDCDDDVWYYLAGLKEEWINWESTDGFSRYLDTPVYKIRHPF